jgi:NitT/TauT family transport system substrate-binding protein
MPSTISRSAALTLAAAALAPRPVRGQSGAVVRMGGTTAGDSFFLPFYAQEQGFFRRAGVNVELSNHTNTGVIAAAMTGGALDVGYADPLFVANAYNRGLPWAFFAGGGLYSSEAPTTVLCLAQNSSIKTPKDLEGKQVAIAIIASVGVVALQAWLEANGADASSVKLYETPYATMVPLLQKGDIAAAFIAEPSLSQSKSNVRLWANIYDAIAKSFLISSCYSTRDWLARNGDASARIARALSDAAKWANEHRDDTAAIVSRDAKMPLDVVKSSTRVRYADLDPRLIQPVLDQCYKYKAMQKPVTAAAIIAKV